MATFKASVTEDVKVRRLLSLVGGNGIPELSITEEGGSPDFVSTTELKADTEVNVTMKNNPVWLVEAGEDLTAGTYVDVGKDGVIVASESGGIGFVAELVEEGDTAKLVRSSSGGEQGPQGPDGPKGDPGEDGKDGATGPAGKDGATGPAGKDAEPQFTEEQVTALLALLEE